MSRRGYSAEGRLTVRALSNPWVAKEARQAKGRAKAACAGDQAIYEGDDWAWANACALQGQEALNAL